jgi:hypothetical protein
VHQKFQRIPRGISFTTSLKLAASGSRDVSDPGTDPGVRVEGPKVGSLTSRLLSRADRLRGEDAALPAPKTDATMVRNANRLQEKSTKHASLTVG